MSDGALAVVESWFAAVNRRDGARLEALSAASIEIVGPRGEGRLDRGVLSQWLLRSGFSATPRRWFCGGDGRVVVAHDARWDDVETGATQSTASIASEFVVADGVVDRYVRHDDSLGRHTTPLAYLDLDGTAAVVGSAMGAPHDPAWVHNIRANPAVAVETGIETYEAIATVHTGRERERLFALVVDRDPGFDDYQQRTSRRLPVVTFHRVETGTAWTRGLGDFLVESHDWLRGELTRVRDALDADVPIDVAGFADQLQSHCLTLCSGLTEHHSGEDRGAFPLLADRFPGLAPLLKQLVADHERTAAVDRALRELVERHRDGEDRAAVRLELERLTEELDRHFEHEERNLVAALNSLGPAPS